MALPSDVRKVCDLPQEPFSIPFEGYALTLGAEPLSISTACGKARGFRTSGGKAAPGMYYGLGLARARGACCDGDGGLAPPKYPSEFAFKINCAAIGAAFLPP
jgi:hypothetical protein